MSIFYKSQRIGLKGTIFTLYKFRTLKEGTVTQFSHEEHYTFCGRFLRKYKLDELPQLWNVIIRDMNLVGPRPEEEKTISIIPEKTAEIILSVKPGLTDLASLFFFNEEEILQKSPDPFEDYWTKIKPTKFVLQMFYIENKCLSLDIWIILQTLKRILKATLVR